MTFDMVNRYVSSCALLLTLVATSALGRPPTTRAWRPGLRDIEVLDDSRVISSWQDGAVILSNSAGQDRRLLQQQAEIDPLGSFALKAVASGKRLFVQRLHQSQVLSLPNGKSLFSLTDPKDQPFAHRAYISPDGERLIIDYAADIDPYEIKIVAVDGGKVLASIPAPESFVLDHAAFLQGDRVGLAFSAAGSGASRWHTRVLVWDLKAAKQSWSREYAGERRATIQFDPAGKTVFVWDSSALLLSISDGRVIRAVKAEKGAKLRGAAWSPDGGLLAFADQAHVMVLGGAEGGILADRPMENAEVEAAVGNVVFVRQKGKLQVWNATGALRRQEPDDVGNIEAFAPDGSFAMISTSGGPELFRYETANGKITNCFSRDENAQAACRVNALRIALKVSLRDEDFSTRYLAARELLAALDGADRPPSPFNLQSTQEQYVDVLIGMGEALAAMDMFDEVRSLNLLGASAKDPIGRAGARAGTGQLLLAEGRPVEAVRVGAAALAEFEALPADVQARALETHALLLRLLAESQLALGAPRDALVNVTRAAETLEKLDVPARLDRALVVRARVLEALGQLGEAAAIRKQLLEGQDEDLLKAEAQAELGRNLAVQGQTAEAELWTTRAVDLYQLVGPADGSQLIAALGDRGRLRTQRADGLESGLKDLRRATSILSETVNARANRDRTAKGKADRYRYVFRRLVAADWLAEQTAQGAAPAVAQVRPIVTAQPVGPVKVRGGHGKDIVSLVFSTDGSELVSGANDRTAAVWAVDKPALKLALAEDRVDGLPLHATFAGSDVVTLDSNGLRRFDRTSGAKKPSEQAVQPRGLGRLEVSRDGAMLVAYSDRRRGNLVELFPSDGAPVTLTLPFAESGRLSPDGRRIATIDREEGRKLCFFDLVTRARTNCLPIPSYVDSALAWSPDGKRIALTGQGAAVIDAKSGRVIANVEKRTEYFNAVAFSPDGLRILTGSDDNSARIWSADTGAELQRLEGHGQPVQVVAWSPRGDLVATGAQDGLVRLWRAVDGAPVALLGGATSGHHGSVVLARFSPDERRIVTTGADETFRIWDVVSGDELFQSDTHGSWSSGRPNFSADGALLYVPLQGVLNADTAVKDIDVGSAEFFGPDARFVYWDDNEATVSLADGTDVAKIKLDGGIIGDDDVAGTVDGKRLLINATPYQDHSGDLGLWDPADGRRIAKLDVSDRFPNSVELSPDGALAVVVLHSDIRLFRASDGHPATKLVLPVDPIGWSIRGVDRALFSMDGSALLAWKQTDPWESSEKGAKEAFVWLLKGSGRPMKLELTRRAPEKEALKPAGDDVALPLDDSATDGAAEDEEDAPAHRISAVALSPDGAQAALGGMDGAITFFNLANGNVVRTLRPHTGPVWSIAFSRDGARLLTASGDGRVRVSALADGALVKEIGK